MISWLVLLPFVVVIGFFIAIIFIIKPMADDAEEQREQHEDQFMSVKVAAYDGKAYWIINNQLFRADLDLVGDIDHSTTEAVDAMAIDHDEMPLLFNIIEALKAHGA